LQQEASLFHFDAEFLQIVIEGNFFHERLFDFGRGGEKVAFFPVAILFGLIIF
jgi:hypothetical protein